MSAKIMSDEQEAAKAALIAGMRNVALQVQPMLNIIEISDEMRRLAFELEEELWAEEQIL